MIQRIQSALMLIAAVILGLEFIFPFATSTKTGTGYFSDSVFNIFDNPILLGLVAVSLILCVLAIFLYKNRKLQSNLNWLTAILCAAILGAGYFLASKDQSGAFNGINIGIGSMLPLISLVLLIAANRYINKDENLVKSMDRLR